ncbi:MAG: hypothetical protein IJO26_02910 [Clostridium sp.]|nr:hypothetical protein [Clostridium sp.]
MSQLNKLYRNFIILQEDERGYSNSNDKTLSGYSKIEAKGNVCRISFYAQNLRKDEEDYCILAICNKKDFKKVLNLGKISVSDGGKAEVIKEYPVDNIGGLGISYDKLSGAAIAKLKNGIPIIVMCGFVNNEQVSDGWKNYSIVNCANYKDKSESYNKKDKSENHKKEDKKKDCKKKEDKKNKHREEELRSEEYTEEYIEEVLNEEIRNEEEVLNEEIRNEEENKVIEVNENDVRGQEDSTNEVTNSDNPFEGNFSDENPFDNRSEENLYGIKDLNRNATRNKFDEYEEKLEENNEYKIRGSVGEYFESLANGFECCTDKYREIKYCKWYKVPVNDLHEMCNMSNYNRYTVAYYPMLNYYPYIRKYKHFMLGYKCDEKGNLRYIVYGVPGEKNKDEQPYEGKTGFVTWVNDGNRDGVGCWLMFYDFKNSTVVVPMT